MSDMTKAQWDSIHNNSRCATRDSLSEDLVQNIMYQLDVSRTHDAGGDVADGSINKAVYQTAILNGIDVTGYNGKWDLTTLATKLKKDMLYGKNGTSQGNTPIDTLSFRGYPTPICSATTTPEDQGTHVTVIESTVNGAFQGDVWVAGVNEFYDLKVVAVLQYPVPFDVRVKVTLDASLPITIGGLSGKGFIAVANHEGVYFQPEAGNDLVFDVVVSAGTTLGSVFISDHNTISDAEHTIKCFVDGRPDDSLLVSLISIVDTNQHTVNFPIYPIDTEVRMETTQPITLNLPAVITCVTATEVNYTIGTENSSQVSQTWTQERLSTAPDACEVSSILLDSESVPCVRLIDGEGTTSFWSSDLKVCGSTDCTETWKGVAVDTWMYEWQDEGGGTSRLRRKFRISGGKVVEQESALWIGPE